MNNNIYFGMFAVLLGLSNFFLNPPFPDDTMALVIALPPNWVVYTTSLLLPLIMVVAGFMLIFRKKSANKVLTLVYSWYLVVFIWGLVAKLSHPYIAFSIAIKNPITLGLAGGAVFYCLLAIYATFFISSGPQSNNSLKSGTPQSGAP